MNKEVINNIIKEFARNNIVFSNEYDFQFEFAQALQKISFVKDVKMENLSLDIDMKEVKEIAKKKGKLSAKRKEYTDIIVETNDGKFYAFELKYKTPDRICFYENTKYGDVVTMVQGAYDLNAHAFWHDVERLENINNRYLSKSIKIEKGFAIFLTNNIVYKTNDFSGSSIWKKYSMEEGKKLTTGNLGFRELNATVYTTPKGKKYTAVNLRNEYKDLSWQEYELPIYGNINMEKTEHPNFYYLILGVDPVTY